MLAIANRDRTLTGVEESWLLRHLAECDTCRTLSIFARDELWIDRGGRGNETDREIASIDTQQDRRWVAWIPEDAFDDPNLLVLPVVDPIIFDEQREIASGGMGRITRANDRRLGREVAIKEVLEPAMRARFEREAMITARLQHPAIVPIYEAGTWPNGSAFYTMRLVQGGTLAESIASTTTMAERVALLPHVVAVTEALAYAHSRNIIHRDLKPSNVLVGAFGETVVIDWGLAKELGSKIDVTLPHGVTSSQQGLTHAGAVLGTPGFMSPEQAGGEELDERADVYALGSILYNVLAGVAPYGGKRADDNPDLIIALGRIKPPTPIAELAPDAPADLLAIVERAMARSKQTRYPSAREMADELRRFQTGKLIAAREYRLRDLLARWIRKHRTAVAVGAIATLVLAVISVLAVVNVTRSRQDALDNLARAESSAAATLEEQARTELLLGDAERGLTYASAAYSQGRDTPALRYLLAAATRDLGLVQHVIKPPEMTTSCGTDPNCLGTDVAALGFTPDGRVVLVENTGRISTWSATSLLKVIPLGHPIDGAQVDAGARVAATLDDNTLEVWDVEAGVRRWRASVDQLYMQPRLLFDPKSRLVVLASDDDEIHPAYVYDVETGTLLATLELGDAHVAAVAFSTDSRRLAACGFDGTLKVWEVAVAPPARFAPIATWHGTQGCTMLAFAGLDRLVVDAGTSSAEIWEIGTGKRLHVLGGHAAMLSIAATVDGSLIATGDDHIVRLWNGKGELIAQTRDQKGQMAHLIFGHGILVGAGMDSAVYVWETPSLELRRALGGHDGGTDLLAVDPGGEHITASGVSDQRVIVWNVPRGNRIDRVPSTLVELAGNQWVSYDATGIWLRRSDTGTPIRRLELARTTSSSLATSDDGRLLLNDGASTRVYDLRTAAPAVSLATKGLVTLSRHGRFAVDSWQNDANQRVMTVFDTSTARVVFEKKFGSKVQVGDADLSPDGERLAVGMGHDVRVWAVATGKPMWTSKIPGPESVGYTPRFDPTGRTLVTFASGSGQVQLFDADTGTLLATLHDTNEVDALAFSRDGIRLLTHNENSVVRLWTARAGTLVTSVDRSTAAFAFASDGKRFATGSNEGTVRLWDTETGRQVATLRDHRDPIAWVGFSDDGERLIARSEDATASLWDVHVERRTPGEIAALADQFSRWKLVDGLLVAK